ncbi:DUF1573 domain-containing protein [Porphyromonas crevioricanis]|nr:DUF1573 domain-containing protein [Porphyromonas crevioricanis]
MINKHIRSCLLVALLLIGSSLFAQQRGKAELSFQDTIHHFGNIAEEKGSVYCEFLFTNTGTIPLVLTRVNSDCGCTSPSWPEEAIEPGAEGRIVVSYDPAGRPGAFVKRVYVYSNATKTKQDLLIKGYVTTLGGGEKGQFSAEVGPVKLSRTELLFPTTSRNRTSSVRLMLLNTSNGGKVKVSVQSKNSLIEVNPEVIELSPGEPAELELSLKVLSDTEIGMHNEPVELIILDNEGKEFRGRVLTRSTVVEDFSFYQNREEMIRTAPRMDLNTYFDLGTLPAESPEQQVEVEIRNTGKGLLKLRNLNCDNPAVQILDYPEEITQGTSGILKIRVLPSTLKEKGWASIAPNINIVCNDPYAPLRRVKVKLSIKH